MTHFFRCFWAVVLALGLPMAGAQTRTVPRVVPKPTVVEPRTQPSAALPVPIGSGFTLRGLTLQGQVFGLSLLRGRVVLIHYWATDCAVCLDKMADLRRRAEAWQGQRFSVVYVQMDKQLASAQSYWQMVGMTQRGGSPATVLWRRDAAYRDSLPLSRPTTLPFSVLLNPEGRVVTSVEGRIPPQIWAQVAEQLR
jgi:thiol-disulfide isomerase/thioredoxin